MRMTMWHLLISWIVIGISVFLGVSHGADQVQVTVKVTILAPTPCSINNNQPIVVDFGEVLTTRVDGKNYRRPIEYNLSCPENKLVKNALKLQVVGTEVNLGGTITALAVPAVSDFGIQLQQGTIPMKLNQWLTFTYPNMPVLYAVPVMKAGTKLKAGGFTATSTLILDYQ